MDIKEAIYTRRSVRDFTDEEVEQALVSQLIEAATQAPSAVNQQPWMFNIIRERSSLGRMSHDIAEYLLRTSAAGASSHFRNIMLEPGFDVFHNAPLLIVISGKSESPWTVVDCALAAQNLMLTAHALGLGTCWIGSAQSWLATPEGRALLGLADKVAPVAPIVVGHPRSAPLPVPRKAPEIHKGECEPPLRRQLQAG